MFSKVIFYIKVFVFFVKTLHVTKKKNFLCTHLSKNEIYTTFLKYCIILNGTFYLKKILFFYILNKKIITDISFNDEDADDYVFMQSLCTNQRESRNEYVEIS